VSPVRVLFLCTGNSARSLIAEALLKELGGAAVDVHSAGTHPRGINPYTERVLAEEGLRSGGLRSKSLDMFTGLRFDYVITVCDSAAEECPIFPGAPERIHWSFADPAAVEGADIVKLAAFRETLAGMRCRIEAFIPVALNATARSNR
jgi:protein-tyrosine-phosphatase